MKNILVLVFVFRSLFLFSQDCDTNRIFFMAKMQLFTYNKADMPIECYDGFIRFKPQIEKIKTSGFDSSFNFYRLIAKSYTDTTIYPIVNGKRKVYTYWPCLNDTLIFCIFTSNKASEFIRIKGFIENDFNDFFYLVCYHYERNSGFTKQLKGKKQFKTNFYIEGVDLGALYDYHIKKKKRRIKCIKTIPFCM